MTTKKLMTIKELSVYLRLGEEKIVSLVEENVIPAYKIGGELMRFRKEQVDAVLSEIDSYLGRVGSGKTLELQTARKEKEKLNVLNYDKGENDFHDTVRDFFYFNDFYIVSGILIVILLIIIFR